jgi:hypothetical protein
MPGMSQNKRVTKRSKEGTITIAESVVQGVSVTRGQPFLNSYSGALPLLVLIFKTLLDWGVVFE